jgi:hypothetical protein
MYPNESETKLVLLSYDVTKGNRPSASRVAQLIFGRPDVGKETSRPFIARRGAIWIGQSVFILGEADGRELAERLRGLGAILTMALIAFDASRFEAFRLRASARRPT